MPYLLDPYPHRSLQSHPSALHIRRDLQPVVRVQRVDAPTEHEYWSSSRLCI
jgi:hypothetical protein